MDSLKPLSRRAAGIALAALLLAPAAFAQPGRGPQAPPVVSPEVKAGRHIVFRIYAPKAEAVRLSASDIPGMGLGAGQAAAGQAPPGQMTKGENGVWEITVGPVEPGSYR